MRRFALVFALVLALLDAAHSVEAADAPAWREVNLHAYVTIGVDGKLAAVEWSGKSEGEQWLARNLDARVRSWQFEPGKLDGVPAETRTGLHIRLFVAPQPDGGLALKVLNAYTGPSLVARAQPQFPPAALKGNSEAAVRAELAVASDGSVTIAGIEMEATGNKVQFERAVRDALEQWRFEPETVGGRAIASRIVVPVTYCKAMRRGAPSLLPGSGGSTPSRCLELIQARAAKDAAAGWPAMPEGQPVALDSATRLKADVRDPMM